MIGDRIKVNGKDCRVVRETPRATLAVPVRGTRRVYVVSPPPVRRPS